MLRRSLRNGKSSARRGGLGAARARLEALEGRTLFASVGPDGYGYVANDGEPVNVDLVPGGAGVVAMLDDEDDAVAALPLGDNAFRFYGTTYGGAASLFVNTNGLLTLGSAYEEGATNLDLSSEPSQATIAPLWDDWLTDEQTTGPGNDVVLYRFDNIDGDPAPDRLVVEWNQVRHFDDPSDPVTFQAILELNTLGADGQVIFNYLDVDAGNDDITDGAGATVGIKDDGPQGPNRLVVSFDDDSGSFVGDDRSVRIATSPNAGSIAGRKYHDADADGARDAAEPFLSGWTIYLDADNDGTLDLGETRTATGAGGAYHFGGLSAGTYVVREVQQTGWQQTEPAAGAPYTINLAAGQRREFVDFGNRALPGEIRGANWSDYDADGVRDAGEPGLANWKIYLDTDADGIHDPGERFTTTDNSGNYAFTNVAPGGYTVAEEQPPGWRQTFPAGPGGPALRAAAVANVGPQSDAVAAAIRRASDLSRYTKREIAEAEEWVVGLTAGKSARSIKSVATSVRARRHEPVEAGRLANAHVLAVARGRGAEVVRRLKADRGVKFFYPLVARQQHKRFEPTDPLFGTQWHLRNTGSNTSPPGVPGNDANVVPAWDTALGTGVLIGIVDDGLQGTHEDLAANYVAAHSFDFNGDDSNPAPEAGDHHGTAVAGVAAARANNARGGVGAAPNAGLAGLRLISVPTTDDEEADALEYHSDDIDIYSNSWGPDDSGELEGPGPEVLDALGDAVREGRNGLGNVYVWAAGNGLTAGDNVNYDGYANSRYVIAVTAVDARGEQADYAEPGAPILVSAYSDTAGGNGIVTTDRTGNEGYVPGNYVTDFGGTSASTPLVSGVVALILQANPNLSWRDVKQILATTARRNDPTDAEWRQNGAGHFVNHKYGFGAVDAAAAVAAAQTWTPVAPEVSATSGRVAVSSTVPDNNATGVTSSAFIGDAITVETVEVVFDASHARRGDLRVVLTSPDGTQSVLAERRGTDDGNDYDAWVFTSARHLGEQGQGSWTLKVTDAGGGEVGVFEGWKLNVYGTRSATDVHFVTVNPGQLVTGKNFGNHDTAAPTVDINDVTPDPRTTSVNTITITFNESVAGFGREDLVLSRNGGPNLLTAAQTLSPSGGNRIFTLGNLSSLTGTPGEYTLTLTAAGSGIADPSGNALGSGAADTWARISTIGGRRVFYNRSAFDGNDPAANAADDAAIATDKAPLLPGGTATFANYTSYTRGINGVMIDVTGLPAATTLTAADFTFRVGNDNTPADWAAAPAPSSISRRALTGGAERITLVWPDGAIRNQWLRVTMFPGERTGLPSADVFYFGNAVGESGNSRTDADVNYADEVATRSHRRSTVNLAPVTWPWDYNRDRLVSTADQLIVRRARASAAGPLALISVPGGQTGTVSGVTPRAPRAAGAAPRLPAVLAGHVVNDADENTSAAGTLLDSTRRP